MVRVFNKHTGDIALWDFEKFRKLRPMTDEEWLALRKVGEGESRHEWWTITEEAT